MKKAIAHVATGLQFTELHRNLLEMACTRKSIWLSETDGNRSSVWRRAVTDLMCCGYLAPCERGEGSGLNHYLQHYHITPRGFEVVSAWRRKPCWWG